MFWKKVALKIVPGSVLSYVLYNMIRACPQQCTMHPYSVPHVIELEPPSSKLKAINTCMSYSSSTTDRVYSDTCWTQEQSHACLFVNIMGIQIVAKCRHVSYIFIFSGQTKTRVRATVS